MNSSSNDFTQEIAALSDTFSLTGERLLQAARRLHTPGSPPPDSLVVELNTSRREFQNLRDRILGYARSLHVATPSADQVDSLQGLTALIDEVVETEIRRSRSEEIRGRALSVLDRVLAIGPAGTSEIAALHPCQERARQLRAAIADATWSDLPDESEPLSEGDHPMAHLLALVEDRDELHDEHWGNMHDSVVAAFGRPLGAAAARAKLVVRPAEALRNEPSFATS
jgi:hypothetical protein